MNISALTSAMSAMQTMRAPEASEGKGPDHDNDADNQGVANSSAASASLPKGMGVSVDTKA